MTPHQFNNWQDYEKLRDPNKLLIIYGAGVSGQHFLNVNKVIPNYFSDKNFAEMKEIVSNDKKYKITCISPQEMEKILKVQAADVIISIVDIKILRTLLVWFKEMKLNKDVKIYFYHDFDVEIGTKVYSGESIFINSKYAFLGNNSKGLFNFNLYYQTMPSKMFKKAMRAFKNKISTKEEFSNMLQLNSNNAIYKDNFLISKRNITKFQNKAQNTIYLIGRCAFASYFSSSEDNKIDYILQNLLNKYRANFYNVETKFSINGISAELSLDNLKKLTLKKGDIVIFYSFDFKLELALQAKYICERQNCRLISYNHISIFNRKYLSDYEKIILKGITSEEFKTLKNISQIEIQFFETLNYLDIEVYEVPYEFYNSKETIMLDFCGAHFGDYGNEIIAKHLFDIITGKVTFKKNYNKDIEVGMQIISKVIPEIYLYAEELKRKHKPKFQNSGSIVMNCNPFTLGHLHLIEYAASKVELLYIFVVEEDKSEFKFKDRFKLVKENTKHLKNVKVLPSGKFIISNQTFGEYFSKSNLTEEERKPDVSLDLLIFSAAIAPTLGIKTRFVGEEPFDPVTNHYNQEMKRILPKYGLEVVEIPRKEKGSSAISASRVRKLLAEKNFKEIKKLVPAATLKFLFHRFN